MYQQIIDQITAKITAGDWSAGQGLPSIRELASASRVSVITVKRAYLELERAGLIVTRQGRGSFVTTSQELPKALLRANAAQHLSAWIACARQLGQDPQDMVQQLLAALNATIESDEKDTP
ncbi:GntR family transcriptional regulator [Ahniella affigens]|uniref:GntR family transcriptional regulator n=2 Tax=Ahniella affigens TaxID=2021234 RepID=A0A2P1PYX8_9GAMM|nr:GntR family transcriptional regulator [Ahniella affigens]